MPMLKQLRVLAFDVDDESLTALRQAFPEWEIDATSGATAASLRGAWAPVAVDLLVIGSGNHLSDMLGLCRGLRSQPGRAHTPLLALVSAPQDVATSAALRAGASGCLVLPVHAKELLSLVARVRHGNQPGRHTLALHPAQRENPWQDVGGEA
jgi:DNA-binding response OmpR family regulator